MDINPDSIGVEEGPMTGFCVRHNEPLGFTEHIFLTR
jgi:hypothetical protein